MQNSKNPSPRRLKDESILYLANKWYFTNEADMFSAPFDTYEACKKALDSHDEYLVL